MEVVFLGVNDVGMRVYEWLCDRESVDVRSMVTTADQLDLVREIEPAMLVSVGYDHLVPEEILAVPERGGVNLHPSYLPHNRGKSPNVWSIVSGTPAGVTLHRMDASFDTGPIVAQRRVETEFDDTGKDLHRRLEAAQFELFRDVWPAVEDGSADVVPQSDESGEYHSQSDFEALCELDPDAEFTVKELLDRLRALTFPPFDNAFLEVDGQRYYVDVDITAADEVGDEDPPGLLGSY